jgi:hypothetical protein
MVEESRTVVWFAICAEGNIITKKTQLRPTTRNFFKFPPHDTS